ncbi:triphosphoribosyl-dephospho-CoA synthase [Halobacillus massiliensis]|uniref:triphosphoribosyl-dephospho-CoA synthase n=1 Tax=Halobacillus massiliensis TaxID=1926286 RepID=UPI0009E4DD72|nr:triphosphoribosyl-dephospho-CoA synthase [Halobacillus massiliensis]
MNWSSAKECRKILSDWAVDSLVQEAELAPKPGLVDPQDQGAHEDMNFELMIKSSLSLKETFANIAEISYKREPSQELREQIAEIGREGERKMMKATGGVNTHKGAIWGIGLLTSGAAVNTPGTNIKKVVETASFISRFPDRFAPEISTNGYKLYKKLGVKGARGEAASGFPRLINVALPQLSESRRKGSSESSARLDTLVALIACLEDTCILHRSGILALRLIQEKARRVLQNGGVSKPEGRMELNDLNHLLLQYNSSPGGSADLLAAALFLDRLNSHSSLKDRTMAVN